MRPHKRALIQKTPTRQYRFWVLVSVLTVILLFCLSTTHAQEANQQIKSSRIIVLDPGHGGRDTGASGPENVVEKNIVMAFARIMTEKLKTSYRVILTRKDDYQVSLFDRTALANHNQADLFISFHTGASYRSNPRGISIFYYESIDRQSSGAGFQDDLQTESSLTIQHWEQRRPHLTNKSRYFVELLKKRLSSKYQDLEIYSGGASLVTLAGARMPAVLIEIGHVTNPLDAKSLSNDAWLTEMAGHFCIAIDEFFADDLSL